VALERIQISLEQGFGPVALERIQISLEQVKAYWLKQAAE
jgi:hypothetical protein